MSYGFALPSALNNNTSLGMSESQVSAWVPKRERSTASNKAQQNMQSILPLGGNNKHVWPLQAKTQWRVKPGYKGDASSSWDATKM